MSHHKHLPHLDELPLTVMEGAEHGHGCCSGDKDQGEGGCCSKQEKTSGCGGKCGCGHNESHRGHHHGRGHGHPRRHRGRRCLGFMALTDLALKAVALHTAVKKDDKGWIIPLALVNSMGILPAYYLLTKGRQQ